jgi:hypothetical protein
MNASVVQTHPLIQIRRNRTLPVPGTVLVRIGQKVTTNDVIAETEMPSQFHYVDVMRSFGLSTPSQAEQLINRKVGDQVDKNDILAETGGMFSRIIRSPRAGTILSIRNGQMLVETEKYKLTISAGFNGKVVEIIKDEGAVVETNGVLIQGMWGNGRTGFGQLHIKGMVIVAGYCSNSELIEAAAHLPVGGLIIGSINPDLIQVAQKQTYPILVIEGYGKTLINDYSRRLLVTNSGRETAVNAVKWNRWTGERPELIISLPSEGDAYREIVELRLGQLTRVHTSPYAGKLAMVDSLKDGMTMLPNRIKTNAVGLKFLNNEQAAIPLHNFELIDLDNRYLGKSE